MKYINTSKLLLFVFLSSILFTYSCQQKAESKSVPDVLKKSEIGFNEDLKNVKTFDDLVKHLNEYHVLWRTMFTASRDFDYVRDMASELARIQNQGNLSSIDQKLMSDILKGIPVEGGLRELFLDLWIDSQKTN